MLAMMHKKPDVYYIKAEWDSESNRWSATSEDIPGLVLEEATFEDLTKSIHELAPQLIEMNCGGDFPDLPIFVQANYSSRISGRRAV